MFAFSLAREFHRLDVDAMLAEMTSTQLEEWKAFFKAENERIEDRRRGRKKPQDKANLANRLEAAFDGMIARRSGKDKVH